MGRKIDIDEAQSIRIFADAYMRRLSELASKFEPGDASSGGSVVDLSADKGKVPGTLLSPGLKLKFKDKSGAWPMGSLWIVVGQTERGDVKLIHDNGENREELIVSKEELDGKFELR